MKPQSGYDLRKTFSSTPMRHYSDSPGSIYPALRRLEARKFISGSPEDGNARKRQVYRVTATGKKAFVQWLEQRVSRDDIIWRIDDLILRFAFFDGNVSRSTSRQFLIDLERALESYIRELQGYAADSGMTKAINTGTLAFAFGVEGYQASLAWARRTLKHFAGERQ